MKDIMYSIGEKDFQGIGTFEFIPSCDKDNYLQLDIIDLFNTPFEEFKQNICEKYRGAHIKVKDLIDDDIANTKFVRPQYKEALKQLENEHRITCLPENRRKNTMGDNVDILFQ